MQHAMDMGARKRRDTGPVAADYTVDQNWDDYTPEEHQRWNVLAARQVKLLPGRAADVFVDALGRLDLQGGIPHMGRLSDHLERLTGWRVAAVPNLVPDEVFFEHLANRRFPAGAFIRDADEMDYIEEPDVFHDVFGHVPLLADPAFADFVAAYGRAGLDSAGRGMLPHLARLYWYTVEFGLIETAEGLRIYGAGILSSPAETVFALDDRAPHRVGFDAVRVMRTRYRIDDFQQTYFVIPRFEQLLDTLESDLDALYAKLEGAANIGPDTLRPGDRVVTRGTQSRWLDVAS